MKKGVLLITIGMVIVVIAYFGVQMFESVKGVQKDIQQNETKLEQKPIVKSKSKTREREMSRFVL